MGEYTFLIGSAVIVFVVIVSGIMISKSQKKAEEGRVRSAKNANKRAAAAGKVKKIKWKDLFSIDQGAIDKDHKTMIGLVNQFNAGIPKYQSPDQMVSILMSLTKFSQKHFQREEKLQKISGYLSYEDHKKEHADLIGKFNGLKKKAMQANEDNVTDVAVEIGMFLEKWLTEHEIGSDLPMKHYVDRKREQATSMEKLPEQTEATSL